MTTFAITLGTIYYLSYLVMGNSWTFMYSTLGFTLAVPELTPNMGLFWYFFTEMFEHFRVFFVCTFQINCFVYVYPLASRLKNQVHFTLSPNLIPPHSMARANLNKSEEVLTNTTAASKYIPRTPSRRPRICINRNPSFRPKFTYRKSTSKRKHCETRITLFLENLMKWGLKGGFQLMLILVFLGQRCS